MSLVCLHLCTVISIHRKSARILSILARVVQAPQPGSLLGGCQENGAEKSCSAASAVHLYTKSPNPTGFQCSRSLNKIGVAHTVVQQTGNLIRNRAI